MSENKPQEEHLIDLTEQAPEAPQQAQAAPEASEVKESEAPAKEEKKDLHLPKGQNIESIIPVAIVGGKVTKDEDGNRALTVALPSGLPEYIDSSLSAAPNVEVGTDEHASQWVMAMQDGLRNTSFGMLGLGALENPDSLWAQGIQHPSGAMLSATDPKTKSSSGQILEGEQAQLQFLRYAGLGSLFSVPLWHTGIWITLKCPSDVELMDVHRALSNDKIELGRSSYGLSMSAGTAVSSELLVALALRNIYMTSVKTANASDLQDIISSQDVPALIWGLASVVWNSGFDFQRVCTHEPEKCNHIHRERIDLSKLFWVNKAALNDKQIAHMYKRKASSMTVEEVKAYQAEFDKSRTTRLNFREDSDAPYQFELQVPSVRKYFINANRWIDSTVATVERAVTVTDDEEERKSMVMENARMTTMRNYGHWVKSIIFNENVLQADKDIEGILDRLSAENDISEQFNDGVKKLINETMISLVGIPDYECPNCHKKQMHEGETPEHPMSSLIPLDPVNTFFSLLVHRLNQFLR